MGTQATRRVTFRSVGGLDLSFDVIGHTDAVDQAALLWFHGGALCLGSRAELPADVVAAATAAGAMVLSADYRLAPQANVSEIGSDVAAALAWLQEVGPSELGVDPNRIVVAGLSAGGYLSLLTGVGPRPPRAIVSYYGYGTLDNAWYREPSDHYRETYDLVDRDVALAAAGDELTVDGSTRPNAGLFYLYCRQNGLWPELVAGASRTDGRGLLRDYSPLYRVSEAFPETLLVHGTADQDVPHAESAALAAMLKRHGVPHEFVSLDGLGHGLVPASGAQAAEVERATTIATDFLGRVLT